MSHNGGRRAAARLWARAERSLVGEQGRLQRHKKQPSSLFAWEGAQRLFRCGSGVRIGPLRGCR
jgi:hypothetical protein